MNRITERYHLMNLNQVYVFQQTKNLLKFHMHWVNYQLNPYHKLFVQSF